MKDQFSTFFDAAKDVGEKIREKASNLSQAAVDNTIQAIEKWLEEFPRIEAYGLQIATFSFNVGLSPSLEVEMRGVRADFPSERLAQIIAENKSGSLTAMVFGAVKTAYRLHGKISQTPDEALFVRIRLSISPEISVFIGRPKIVS